MKKIMLGVAIGVILILGFTRVFQGTNFFSRYMFNDKEAPTIVEPTHFKVVSLNSSAEDILDTIDCYDNLDNYCKLEILTELDTSTPGEKIIEVEAKDTAGNSSNASLRYYVSIPNENNSTTRPEVTITIKNYGEMTITLYPNLAPITVNNFIFYILNGSYDGSSFHRVIEDFMIQGGIVDETVCPIYGEFNNNGFDNPLLHTRGVLAMARTMASNNTQTSQFFIVHEDSPFLDGDYTTFGKLTTGYDVLDMIAEAATDMNDAPLQQIIIEEITVQLDGYELSEVNCYE